jgi:hypothetical protein
LDRHLLGIDHLIIGVRDLEAARQRYARLGFNSTPRGRHVGWGTANYCIMFEQDYLELLGVVDPDGFTNDLDRFLAEREGLMGIALASRDAAGTHAAWTAAGLAPDAPKPLGRLLEGEDGPIELRFANVMLPREATDGVGFFACEHLTSEELRRPPWLMHPNGARAIRSCTIVAAEPAPVVAVLSRLLGAAAITDTDQVTAAHVGRAVILVAPPEDAQLMHPLIDPALIDLAADAGRPQLAALTLAVADPSRAADFLRLQDVAFRQAPNGDVLVPPAETHGLALELTRG